MKIELGGKWQIVSDGTQFILNELRDVTNPNTGITRQEWQWNGYYSTIESCLVMLPNKMALRSDASTLAELLQELKNFQKMVEDSFNGIKTKTMIRRSK